MNVARYKITLNSSLNPSKSLFVSLDRTVTDDSVLFCIFYHLLNAFYHKDKNPLLLTLKTRLRNILRFYIVHEMGASER